MPPVWLRLPTVRGSTVRRGSGRPCSPTLPRSGLGVTIPIPSPTGRTADAAGHQVRVRGRVPCGVRGVGGLLDAIRRGRPVAAGGDPEGMAWIGRDRACADRAGIGLGRAEGGLGVTWAAGGSTGTVTGVACARQ